MFPFQGTEHHSNVPAIWKTRKETVMGRRLLLQKRCVLFMQGPHQEINERLHCAERAHNLFYQP